MSIGAHDFTATQFGVSGGESAASNHWSITVGTPAVAPTEVVTITGLYDDTSGSLVLVNKGGSTLDTTPIVKGTVDHALLSGESLAVYRDGTKVGTATMNGSSWSFNDSGVGVGSHTYTARVENSVGNSGFSAGYSFTESANITYPKIGVKGVLNSTLGIMIVCDGATSVTAPPSQFYIWQTNFGFHAWTGDYGQKYWVGETATGGNVAIQQGYYLPTDVFIFKGKDASGNAWTMTTTWGALWSINVLGQTNYLDGVKVTYSAMRDQSVSDAQEVTDLLHASVASNATVDQAVDVADHLRTVVGEHESFKGTTGHDTVDLNADPTSYFKESTAHIEGSTVHPVEAVGSVPAANTLHLTGDHQVLDLTSLTGKTAAAKISGIEAIDLGGHHNTLKLSLTDVLNLGETDLFMKDGKQQMMVQGKEGDEVDLSNSHIAGLAEGEWQAHGTAQVGGVTYNVYEHSGAHTELLVQQGVQIVVH
ncbi:hypothetical protein ASG35_30450 [Burkholderia sp. Leaf177]|nr:hypothetical protein ASG35_30450 [Burkholderia sp. Leaf177]